VLYSHPGKPLIEHLQQVSLLCSQSIAAIPWSHSALAETLTEAARIIGLYHDIGKGTSYFQEYLAWSEAKRNGTPRQAMGFDERLKNHALLSSIAAFLALKQSLAHASWGTAEDREVLAELGYYVIRQHHADLDDDLGNALSVEDEHHLLHRQLAALDLEYFSRLPYWSEVSSVLANEEQLWADGAIASLLDSRNSFLDWKEARLRVDGDLRFYLIGSLLYSSLLQADKVDASETQIPVRPSIGGAALKAYRQEHFGAVETDNPMNHLRDWAYRTAADSGDHDTGHHICSMSLPTGSGKTLAALGWALALRDRLKKDRGFTPRIIYALPFISIVDQNFQVFQSVFAAGGQEPPSDVILAHTHLSDGQYRTHETEDSNDDQQSASGHDELLIEGWESEIVVTTFVQFFATLFAGGNRTARRLQHVAGSIVILDEVQAFPHQYWLLFRRMAETMAELTGTYFLLCTATQPAVFDAPHEVAPESAELPPIAPRTELLWEADEPTSVKDFVTMVLERRREDAGRSLLVLNTIGCAEKVYAEIQARLEEPERVTFLSTYVCPAQRLARIQHLRDQPDEGGFVISTQLVEAGVDIDNEAAYRDMAPLDSIIQVAGRVNRGGLRDSGRVTVVSLQDDHCVPYARFIYDPVLRAETERLFQGRTSPVPESEYTELSHLYYQRIRQATSDDCSRKILASLSTLDFSSLQDFVLIDEDRPRVSVFVELDAQASMALEEYRSCMDIADPWKRREGWHRVRNRFMGFVVNVPASFMADCEIPPLDASATFFHISPALLNTYYDEVTGFRKYDGSPRIW